MANHRNRFDECKRCKCNSCKSVIQCNCCEGCSGEAIENDTPFAFFKSECDEFEKDTELRD